MKFIVAILLTALLAFISGIYFPWWSIALAAFVIALLVSQRPLGAFFSGFLGVFLLWMALAAWISMRNDGILAERMASVLPLGGNSILLIVVTGIIGGLISGLGAASGSFLRYR